jgi:hypothetical protein
MFPSLQVLAEVAAAHGLSVGLLRGRIKGLSCKLKGPSQIMLFEARREAAKRLRTERGLSLAQIGRFLGGRDHSTVLRMVDDAYRQRHIARMARRHTEQRGGVDAAPSSAAT